MLIDTRRLLAAQHAPLCMPLLASNSDTISPRRGQSRELVPDWTLQRLVLCSTASLRARLCDAASTVARRATARLSPVVRQGPRTQFVLLSLR
jgi:hypothetical protein